jgi:ferredoxin/flavodoxin---NADP+ reductase
MTPLRVAIIGAGPAGFYACEHLLADAPGDVEVSLIERLPTPFGLVRSGVAPDHQSIKGVTRVYDRIAADPRVTFHGNVEHGRDLRRDDLFAYFHAVIYCVGTRSYRHLGIPGEALPGRTSAGDFVGWYNAHPDQRRLRFDLSGERAVVVGHGNVALDVARILLTPVEELAGTDIADHALAALATSTIREVTLLGWRGPAQVAFTLPELKEVAARDDLDVVIDPAELEEDATLGPDASRGREQVLALLRTLAERPLRGCARRLVIRFMVSPVAVLGDDRVREVDVAHTVLQHDADGVVVARATGRRERIPADLVLTAIGYRGSALAGVPFDPVRGVIPNVRGRVIDPISGQPRTGEYAAGWIKRGPSGVIGTNKPDAHETVDALLEDLGDGALRPVLPGAVFARLLEERCGSVVSYPQWGVINAAEVVRGQVAGRPRDKFTDVDEMLDVAGGTGAATG